MELADGGPWWTWAGDELLDDEIFGDVDREIRELVMRCLGMARSSSGVHQLPNSRAYTNANFVVEEPARRIDSEILLAYCEEIMEELSQEDGSTDDDLKRWVSTYFAEPPEVSHRQSFNPDDLSNTQVSATLVRNGSQRG